MSQKSENQKPSSERIVKDIRRVTRKQYSAEEKIRIVLDGLRGEHSIAELCRREGIAESLYYNWSKEFLEAGKRRPAAEETLIPGCLHGFYVAMHGLSSRSHDALSFTTRVPSEAEIDALIEGTVMTLRWPPPI
jgi:transposase-like protein